MTTTTTRPPQPQASPVELAKPRLPQWAPILVGVGSVALAAMIGLLTGWGYAAMAVIAVVLYIVLMPGWSLVVENRRSAVDRLMTGLVWAAFLGALVPLVSLIWTVVSKGVGAISSTFLTYSMFRTDLDQPVGIYHALMGTLLITALRGADLGADRHLRGDLPDRVRQGQPARPRHHLPGGRDDRHPLDRGRPVRVRAVDPDLRPSARAGLGGSIALAILMIPIVVRSTEEMLRLVPDDLREASYALGVPKWRTIAKVVLPTALGGIVTGVTLAIARVVGETAPLLLIAGLTTRTNFNIFDDRMTTLPVLIFTQNANPGIPPAGGGDPPGIAIAWGGALVLIIIVMVLNLIARVVGKIFAPAKAH